VRITTQWVMDIRVLWGVAITLMEAIRSVADDLTGTRHNTTWMVGLPIWLAVQRSV
jgi:hypothetical protein